MNDILNIALMLVMIVVAPLLTSYVIPYLKKAVENSIGSTNAQFLAEIAQVVADAVSATSQIFVDAHKQDGTFGEYEQREAATMALESCLNSLSPKCKEYINKEYSNLTEFLRNKIEAEVRRQKISYNVLSAEIDEIK